MTAEDQEKEKTKKDRGRENLRLATAEEGGSRKSASKREQRNPREERELSSLLSTLLPSNFTEQTIPKAVFFLLFICV